ncbi:MAG: hypothetical protein SFX18_07285 [Pirellulales bacterium]|nr:hypothetical protein [Pirellulales bacterium]
MSNLQKLVWLLPFYVFGICLPKAVQGADVTPQPRPALGMNLAGPADWSTELPFVDVFRLSREWISQRKGAEWGKGPALALDEQGWVKQLEPDCFAETALCTIDGGHYPSGPWTVLWEGEGKLELSKGKVTVTERNRLVVNIDAAGGGFFLRLLATNPAKPVRNIQVLMPSVTAAQAAKNPWNPKFLNLWRGMACLRFMDLQLTNNSPQKHWADRPRVSDATFTRRGVPVELLCDLANRQQADAWFCLPHQADDEYVREFAKVVRERLDPQLRAYIEYSNEVWNGQFEQHRYAGEQGQRLKLAEKPWEAAWYFTAYRSGQIFDIWEEVFGGRTRLVRVLASQAGNSYVAEQIVNWRDANRQVVEADVLAIAPYISLNLPNEGENLTAAEVAQWSVEQLLDHVEQQALPECIDWMRQHQKIATERGLKLVAYEAGQHFVGVAGGENNEALTKLLLAANRHPHLERIYTAYFAGWEANGGDLLCYFSSVGQWSKWGSWGVVEHLDEDVNKSPKLRGVLRWGTRVNEQLKVKK